MNDFDPELLRYWESLADFGSWLVIIGVAGEGIEILLKILEKHSERLAKWSNKHELSIVAVGGIFWIMVVTGLAAELHGNHKARMLSDVENRQLASTNAQLFLKVEELRKQNLELEASMQPRRITPEQKAIMLGVLKGANGGDSAVIEWSSGDLEASAFATDIIEVLKTAGYSVSPDAQFELADAGAPSSGLSVAFNKDHIPSSVGTLQKAFNEAKIKAFWVGWEGVEEHKIFVIVARKP